MLKMKSSCLEVPLWLSAKMSFNSDQVISWPVGDHLNWVPLYLFLLCFYFFFIATRKQRFLQGDMFTTNYLLYKVLLITNYTKLTLLTVQYAAYTTYMHS